MDALIALTPMAHTPAWSIAVNEATRKALTADSAYNNGDYTQQPEKGWRAWVDVLLTLATRTPDGLKAWPGSTPDVTRTDQLPGGSRCWSRSPGTGGSSEARYTCSMTCRGSASSARASTRTFKSTTPR